MEKIISKFILGALLNFYAFILTLCCMLIAITGYWLFEKKQSVLLLIVFSLLFLYVMYETIHIFSNYKHRLSIYQTLVNRNLSEFHQKSFSDFMGVPCHRMVVRAVLIKIHQNDKYSLLMQEFKKNLQEERKNGSTILLFNQESEGKEWLRIHKK